MKKEVSKPTAVARPRQGPDSPWPLAKWRWRIGCATPLRRRVHPRTWSRPEIRGPARTGS
eukprot:5298642-Heterocapsa_arctica.AAC.1